MRLIPRRTGYKVTYKAEKRYGVFCSRVFIRSTPNTIDLHASRTKRPLAALAGNARITAIDWEIGTPECMLRFSQAVIHPATVSCGGNSVRDPIQALPSCILLIAREHVVYGDAPMQPEYSYSGYIQSEHPYKSHRDYKGIKKLCHTGATSTIVTKGLQDR